MYCHDMPFNLVLAYKCNDERKFIKICAAFSEKSNMCLVTFVPLY